MLREKTSSSAGVAGMVAGVLRYHQGSSDAAAIQIHIAKGVRTEEVSLVHIIWAMSGVRLAGNAPIDCASPSPVNEFVFHDCRERG
jgi:hypothetical protein